MTPPRSQAPRQPVREPLYCAQMLRTVTRALLRQPSFTLAAAGTLAIGIGATTALFTTVDAVLLRPLPYPRSQDLYTVRTYFPSGRFTIGLVASEEMASVAALKDAVASVAMAVPLNLTLVADGPPRQVAAYGVSEGFFGLVGVQMQAGRPVQGGDGVRGAPPVAVVSHRLWSAAFGGRDDLVGRTLTLNDQPVKVVGIAPPGFDVPAGTDLWLNTNTTPLNIGHAYEGFLRVRPGVSIASLQARMNSALALLGPKYPDQEIGRAFAVRSLLAATVGDLGPILVILFAATGLLLALAAVNVTNLLLARSAARAREIAVRAALGATRRRIIAQLLAESVAIAVCGGLAGVAAAKRSLDILLRFGASRLPRVADLSMDLRVLAFAVLVVSATGVLVGLVPALRMADTDIASLINDTGRSVKGSRRTRRWLSGFAIAEVAAAVAIVAGAARLVLSYQHLEDADPGFESRGRLVLDVQPPQAQPPALGRRNAWWDATEARLRDAGASVVAAASTFPLQHDWDSTQFVDLVSRPGVPPDKRPNARTRTVTPQFFAAMGMRLLQGRLLSAADTARSQPVAVVNEAFVKRNLAGANPLGERVKSLHGHIENGTFVPDLTVIVGVVNDVKYASLVGSAEPIVYQPFTQSFADRVSIVVMSDDGAPERHVAAFETAIRSVDPKVPIDAHLATATVASSLERQRLGMWLMLGFAAAALLLATVGMFGVIACVVSQRMGEMAVRQALGATGRQVFTAVMGDGARLTAAGLALGVAIAWWMGTLVGAYVFGVASYDPAVLGGSALAVATVAVLATALPARRAATVELPRALRTD
jgi:putative ABC transport system permease protein